GIDLSTLGVADVTPILGDDDQRRTVRIELGPDTPDGIKRAALLDQTGRAIMQRRAPRWLFSAPVLHRIRLEGHGQSVGVKTLAVQIGAVLNGGLQPAAVLGLPKEGAHRWYVGGQKPAVALARVADGAPLRLNPMDRPEGPFDAVDADAEVRRVKAMLKATQLGGGIDKILSRLVDADADDPNAPPWARELAEATNDGRQTARMPCTSA